MLLFVTSFNIELPNRSDDPIFPARKHITPNPTDDPDKDDMQDYWTNDERHGAVLGCVEYAAICKTASNESCFDPWMDKRPISTLDDETYATGMGLEYSGFWHTIKTRTSKELDATRKIVDRYISMPLAQDQWKLEAHRLFETSMIRAKLEVLELARGTRASMQNFTNRMEGDRRSVCQKIKFQSTGYKNLSVVGLVFAFVAPPALAFRIKTKPVFYWPVYGIWYLGKFPIRGVPTINWPWTGIKKLGTLMSKAAPPTRKLCSKAISLAWMSLKTPFWGLWEVFRALYGFIDGFIGGVIGGARRDLEFVDQIRSTAGQRQDSISMEG